MKQLHIHRRSAYQRQTERHIFPVKAFAVLPKKRRPESFLACLLINRIILDDAAKNVMQVIEYKFKAGGSILENSWYWIA